MRLRARVDTNQKQIVKALRKIGYSVLHLHTLGKGAPDILVGNQGKNFLFEIKDGAKSKSRRELTDDEKEFHSLWKGQLTIATNLDDILKTIQS